MLLTFKLNSNKTKYSQKSTSPIFITMQFTKCRKAFLGFLFCLSLSNQIEAQSNWKFGIGFGLNYSDLLEKISPEASLVIIGSDIPEANPLVPIGSDAKGRMTPQLGFSTFVRAENHFAQKWKLSTSPAISFLGSKYRESSVAKLENVMINLPLLIEYEMFNNFYLGTGPTLDYLVNMTNVNDNGDRNDITSQSDNRYFFGLRHSMSYVIKDWVEIGLSYNHMMTKLYDLNITDLNGSPAGSYSAKINYLQFAIVVRH